MSKAITVRPVCRWAKRFVPKKAQFKTAVRTGINLVVGQDALLNLTLELGPVSESVTITDELPVVNTSTSLVYGLVGGASGERAAAEWSQLR